MFEFAVAGISDPVQATVPWLSLSILVPIVGALLVPLVPDKGAVSYTHLTLPTIYSV